MKAKIISIIFLISVLLVALTLAQQKPIWKGKIEDEKGVKIVKNPREPIYSRDVFQLEEEISIGGKEGKEEYIFYQIGSIEVDEDERIYISDSKESKIKVFNRNGEHLFSMGRKGQGPGEFEKIYRIQITNKNELLVFDSNTRRLSFFLLNGDFIKSIHINFLNVLNLFMNSKGGYIIQSVKLDPVTAYALTSIDLCDSQFNIKMNIAASKPQDVLTPFLSYIVWKPMKNDYIALGNNENYEIDIFDSDGNIVRKIIKAYDPVEVSDEERKQALERLQQQINKDVPRFHPAYNRFTIDEEYRIYVQTWEKPEEEERYFYDVMDPDGKFITKIVLSFPPCIWKKNKLYTIEEDEEGFQFVKRYRVTWNY